MNTTSAQGGTAENPQARGRLRPTVSPTMITERELKQVERANATAATPVVFIHGLWLLPSSWQPWAGLFGGGRVRRADAELAG